MKRLTSLVTAFFFKRHAGEPEERGSISPEVAEAAGQRDPQTDSRRAIS